MPATNQDSLVASILKNLINKFNRVTNRFKVVVCVIEIFAHDHNKNHDCLKIITIG